MNDAGWYGYTGTHCGEFVNQGATLVFDRHGNVHGMRGGGSLGAAPCSGTPTFVDTHRGCNATTTTAYPLRVAELAIGDDDVLRALWVSQSTNDPLLYMERPLTEPLWPAPKLVDTFTYHVAHFRLEPLIGVEALTSVDGSVVSLVGDRIIRHAADLSIAAQTPITWVNVAGQVFDGHPGGIGMLAQTTGATDIDGRQFPPFTQLLEAALRNLCYLAPRGSPRVLLFRKMACPTASRPTRVTSP